MKNQKAIDAGQRLLQQMRDVPPVKMPISDEALQAFERELVKVYDAWLFTEGFEEEPFFKENDVRLVVVRISTTEYSMSFSNKLSHWAHGLMNDKFEYYTPPREPDSPPHRYLNIGLDWDNTCTEDVQAWYMFAKMMVTRGHKVYIVTMRYPSECADIPKVFLNVVTGLYPTSREGKQAHMLANNINIDVWIDDNPKAVYMNAEQAFGHASPQGIVLSGKSDDDHSRQNVPVL